MSTQEKQTTSLTTRARVPFEKEVLKFLLKHEANIVNPVVRSFVRRYVKWLYDCVNQEVTIFPGGTIELMRWTSKEGGSYGYDPASIGSNLGILNETFFTIMGNAYIRQTQQTAPEDLPPLNMQLSIELLKGLSPGLGFYALVHYFATDTSKQDEEWVNRACDLFGEFRDLETWRPTKQVEEAQSVRWILGSAQSPDEPYYHTEFPDTFRSRDPRNYQIGSIPVVQGSKRYSDAYSAQIYHESLQEGYSSGYKQGHKAAYQQYVDETNMLFNKAAIIIECERKRFVDFIRSLRQTLHVLNDNPLMVEDEVQVVTPEGKPTNGYRASSQREEQET